MVKEIQLQVFKYQLEFNRCLGSTFSFDYFTGKKINAFGNLQRFFTSGHKSLKYPAGHLIPSLFLFHFASIYDWSFFDLLFKCSSVCFEQTHKNGLWCFRCGHQLVHCTYWHRAMKRQEYTDSLSHLHWVMFLYCILEFCNMSSLLSLPCDLAMLSQFSCLLTTQWKDSIFPSTCTIGHNLASSFSFVTVIDSLQRKHRSFIPISACRGKLMSWKLWGLLISRALTISHALTEQRTRFKKNMPALL